MLKGFDIVVCDFNIGNAGILLHKLPQGLFAHMRLSKLVFARFQQHF